MKPELFWLALTTILTGVLWIPYILDRMNVRGIMGTMANPTPRDKPHSPWASRLLFSHLNTVENLVVFAILVLILNAIGVSTPKTVFAAALFFWARLAYVVVYTLGLPVLRTLAFLAGFVAQAILALAIFKLI